MTEPTSLRIVSNDREFFQYWSSHNDEPLLIAGKQYRLSDWTWNGAFAEVTFLELVSIDTASESNDGGPAFPHSYLTPQGPTAYDDQAGMSLRDWFAGQALAGIMSKPHGIEMLTAATQKGMTAGEYVAWVAFDAADAMLKVRGKR